jgi:hypothetical protein
LHAKRVDGEDSGLTPVAERGEKDPDGIVVVALVAFAKRRADGAGLGERADAEVDRLGRVPDEDLGGVGGGSAVDRRVEGESGESRCLAPGGLVEATVDDDLGLDARWRDVDLPVTAVVDLRGLGRGNEGEEA